MDDRYIGVFDSGLGGITVLNELIKELPDEKFIFLADTLRSPYGEKTKEELYAIVFSNIETLINRGVKAIVFACNTASSLDLNLIKEKYNLPIVTVLEATLEEVKDTDEKILVAATEATINSEKHKRLINDRFPGLYVEGVACNDIVPSIEFRDLSYSDTLNIVDKYVGKYSSMSFDTLILGCTHYPIWQKQFSEILPGVRMINPAAKTSVLTKNLLKKHNMLSDTKRLHTRDDIFLVTSDKNIFINKMQKIFGIFPEKVEKIQII